MLDMAITQHVEMFLDSWKCDALGQVTHNSNAFSFIDSVWAVEIKEDECQEWVTIAEVDLVWIEVTQKDLWIRRIVWKAHMTLQEWVVLEEIGHVIDFVWQVIQFG